MVPGSRSTRTARGTNLLLEACYGSVWSFICHEHSRATYFIEVDIHALELEVRGAVVDTRAVEAMLAGDGLPESGTNLVTLGRVLAVVVEQRRAESLRIDRSGGEPVAKKHR
jgi:hypothetical protein